MKSGGKTNKRNEGEREKKGSREKMSRIEKKKRGFDYDFDGFWEILSMGFSGSGHIDIHPDIQTFLKREERREITCFGKSPET